MKPADKDFMATLFFGILFLVPMMIIARTLTLVAKDLKLGPQSPIFLWALLAPLLLTFMLQVTPRASTPWPRVSIF